VMGDECNGDASELAVQTSSCSRIYNDRSRKCRRQVVTFVGI